MNRRDVIRTLGGALVVAPFFARSQPAAGRFTIGMLGVGSPGSPASSGPYDAFYARMRDLGYVEGRNISYEARWAHGQLDTLPRLAAELAALRVDVIVASFDPAIVAAKRATSTIPIVMTLATSSPEQGLVASLARPGGNVTGLSNLNVDLSPKLLEMLHSMVPKLSRVAVLISIDDTNNQVQSMVLKNVEAAARSTGTTILPHYARTPQEVENAFSQMSRQKAGALIVTRHPYLNQQARQIAELAAKNRLPAIAGLREYVEAGGLMSYGSSLTGQYRRAAIYVDKILKGAKPGDLPVEQPTIFELFINGKTAKALGLTIPHSLLASADKVIE